MEQKQEKRNKKAKGEKKMMIPIRCFTCGKIIAEVYEEYLKRVNEKKEDPQKALEELGIQKYCCKRTIFSHVDLIDEIIKYPSS